MKTQEGINVRVIHGGTLKSVTFENQHGRPMARVEPDGNTWIASDIKQEEQDTIRGLFFQLPSLVRPLIDNGGIELVVVVPVEYDPMRERFRNVAKQVWP